MINVFRSGEDNYHHSAACWHFLRSKWVSLSLTLTLTLYGLLNVTVSASIYVIESQDIQSENHFVGLSGMSTRERASERRDGKIAHENGHKRLTGRNSAAEDGTDTCLADSLHASVFSELSSCLAATHRTNAVHSWSTRYFRFARDNKSGKRQTLLETGAGTGFDIRDNRRETGSAYLATKTSRQWERVALQIGARQLSNNERERKRFFYDSYLAYQLPIPSEPEESFIRPHFYGKDAYSSKMLHSKLDSKRHDEQPLSRALRIKLNQPLIAIGNRRTHRDMNLLSRGYALFDDPYLVSISAKTEIPIFFEKDNSIDKFASFYIGAGARKRLRDFEQSAGQHSELSFAGREDNNAESLPNTAAAKASLVKSKAQSRYASLGLETKAGLHFSVYHEKDADKEEGASAVGLARTSYQAGYTSGLRLFGKNYQTQVFGVRAEVPASATLAAEQVYSSFGASIAWASRGDSSTYHRLAFERRAVKPASKLTPAEADFNTLLAYPAFYTSYGLENDYGIGGYHELASGNFLQWKVARYSLAKQAGFLTLDKPNSQDRPVYHAKITYAHHFVSSLRSEWSVDFYSRALSYRAPGSLQASGNSSIDSRLQSVNQQAIDETQFSLRLIFRLE